MRDRDAAVGLSALTAAAMRPDTDEVAAAHRMFRREFDVLPTLVHRVPPGAAEKAGQLAEFLGMLSDALRSYLAGADELLWPPLIARAGPPADHVSRAEERHAGLERLLDRCGQSARSWQAGAATAARDELAATLATTRVTLHEYLQDAEQDLLPLVAAHVTVAEWDEFAGRWQRGPGSGPAAALFLGCLMEEASAAERATILARLPLSARLWWYSAWRRSYRRYIRRLRGRPPD